MKYLGYVCIIIGIAAGFYRVPGVIVLGLALISTIAFASARRKDLKSTPMQLKQNMVLDGAFLFFGQSLIMFAAYLLGAFAISPGGAQFVSFITGQR